ncbi:MAG: CU044_2847 family protein [Phormidesmis sp.]
MAQLVPIQLEDGSQIYIEATEDIEVPPTARPGPGIGSEDDLEPEEEVRRGQKGWGSSRGVVGYPDSGRAAAIASQSFKAIEGTIRAYTNSTLSAFKDMAHANVDKVTLQFGIRVSGEAGVPYVTKGTAESNLSITVECSFDKAE